MGDPRPQKMSDVSDVSLQKTGTMAGIDTRKFMPENIGVAIKKTYDLEEREIGAGGFGKVVIGTDKKMPSRKVAIKKVTIPPNDIDKIRALRNEANTMKQLDHPNICRLFEFYESGRFFYFVMELMTGGELFDRIMEDGFITENLAAHVMQQAGGALCFAHNQNVAHRDMKPENIVFLDNDRDKNEIKLIDWGLSFHFGAARMTSKVGSGTYQAPEVMQAKGAYTQSCDIWSLGVIAYVMLCGKPPFWGSTYEILQSMEYGNMPMSGDDWEDISENAKDFIKKCLRWNPAQRMTAGDVMQHAWIRNQMANGRACSDGTLTRVLMNLKQFSLKSQFYTVAIANVARNLDSHNLGEVHQVFKALNTNNDGQLSLEEVKSGFEKIYGGDSAEVKEIAELFAKLDLDGSGTIDYTEFIAAGMGERIVQKEEVLWTVFRQFASDGDGMLQRDDICKALHTGSTVSKAWGDKVCCKVSKQVMEKFGMDKNGSLNFDEFTRLMRETAANNVDSEVGALEVDEITAMVADAERHGSANKAQEAVQRGLSVEYRGGRAKSAPAACGCCSNGKTVARPKPKPEPSCLAGCTSLCAVQ